MITDIDVKKAIEDVSDFNQKGICDKCQEDKSDNVQEGVFLLCERCWNQVNEFIVFNK